MMFSMLSYAVSNLRCFLFGMSHEFLGMNGGEVSLVRAPVPNDKG